MTLEVDPAKLEALRRDVNKWLDSNLTQPDFYLPQNFMGVSNQRQFEFLRDWQRTVYEAGFIGLSWPVEYGGHGLPQAYQEAATTELMRRGSHPPVNSVGLNWAGPLILEMGSEVLKQRFARNILTADEIWCQGFSEPNHGSDLGNLTTRAVRDGEDYVINGSKIWTSIAPYADHIILLARTDPNTHTKHAGLSFFLCPMRIPGVDVQPIRKITGEFGFAQVFFTDARISAELRVGEEGRGWAVAMRTLAYERSIAQGQAYGSTMGFNTSRDVIRVAKQATGRDGRPAIEDPLVRDRLMQFIIDETGIALNSARYHEPALNDEHPQALPLMDKLLQSEQALDMMRFTVEMLGPAAEMFEHESVTFDRGAWVMNYLDAFPFTIGGGASQIQRNIIAERILGLPKD
jgi:alkylation response protein AidB-like acyl-CoA dehydrogenase